MVGSILVLFLKIKAQTGYRLPQHSQPGAQHAIDLPQIFVRQRPAVQLWRQLKLDRQPQLAGTCQLAAVLKTTHRLRHIKGRLHRVVGGRGRHHPIDHDCRPKFFRQLRHRLLIDLPDRSRPAEIRDNSFLRHPGRLAQGLLEELVDPLGHTAVLAVAHNRKPSQSQVEGAERRHRHKRFWGDGAPPVDGEQQQNNRTGSGQQPAQPVHRLPWASFVRQRRIQQRLALFVVMARSHCCDLADFALARRLRQHCAPDLHRRPPEINLRAVQFSVVRHHANAVGLHKQTDQNGAQLAERLSPGQAWGGSGTKRVDHRHSSLALGVCVWARTFPL